MFLFIADILRVMLGFVIDTFSPAYPRFTIIGYSFLISYGILCVSAIYVVNNYKRLKDELRVPWITVVFFYFIIAPSIFILLPRPTISWDAIITGCLFVGVLFKSKFKLKTTGLLFLNCFVLSLGVIVLSMLGVGLFEMTNNLGFTVSIIIVVSSFYVWILKDSII